MIGGGNIANTSTNSNTGFIPNPANHTILAEHRNNSPTNNPILAEHHNNSSSSTMSNLNNTGLLSQINHLNSYINKRIDFLDSKLDTSLQDLNDKIDILTNKISQIADNSNNAGSNITNNDSNTVNDAKVVSILTRNFNNLIKDLSTIRSPSTNMVELSASNYTQPLLEDSTTTANNQEPASQDHSDSFHQPSSQNPQQDPQSPSPTSQQHDQTQGQPAQSQNSQANNQQVNNQFSNFSEFSRPWGKSLSLRSPVPQPNSAPSSPFTSNRFSFDFNTFPLERSASFSRSHPYQQPEGTINASNIQGFPQQHVQSHVQQQQQPLLQQTQQDLIIPNAGLLTSNTKRNHQRVSKKVQSVPINSSSYLLSLNGASNILASSGQVNTTNAAPTNSSSNANNSNASNDSVANNTTSTSNLGTVYQLNTFPNESEHGIDELRETSIDLAIPHEIQNIQNLDPMQKNPKKRRKNSKTSNKTPKLSKQQQPQQLQAQVQKASKDDSTNDSAASGDELNSTTGATVSSASSKSVSGSAVISSKKFTNVPQYKLEKSLKSVQEIWQEYEYGLNDKPPLKFLEAKYNTKWRNETESRTFLRRKKIYDAIENGKDKGFDEGSIIEELEQLRIYTYFDAIKKRPLQWLYSNIPPKYASQ